MLFCLLRGGNCSEILVLKGFGSFFKSTDQNVITVLGVGADDKFVFAKMTVHGKLINLGRQILINALFMSIESYTLSN